MALQSVNNAVKGLASGEEQALTSVLQELQGLKVSVASGATAGSDITVTGIATADTLVSVVLFSSGVPSDVSAEASITSAGKIQLSTTDSSSKKLLVVWRDQDQAIS